MRNRRRPLAAIALVVSAGTLAASATAAEPQDPVGHGCDALSAAVQKAIDDAATAPAKTITIHFHAPAPGTLTGSIAFNATGSTIRVAADPSAAAHSGGCAVGSGGPGVPKGRGRSRIVSTLVRTFTRAGRRTVTFTLNRTGEKMLARLGGEERAYRTRHPHGSRPPAIAFGVSISYEPAG